LDNKAGTLINVRQVKPNRRARLSTCVLLSMAGLQSLPLAAQEADTSPAVRDTFSISSGYFSKDYANNIDYAQFAVDVKSATSRLALYGYDKYADRLNGTFSRFGYFAVSGLLTVSTGIDVSYHEWGHASRMVALGSSASLSSCYDRSCPAPRDFFGYAGSQVFNFKGGYSPGSSRRSSDCKYYKPHAAVGFSASEPNLSTGSTRIPTSGRSVTPSPTKCTKHFKS